MACCIGIPLNSNEINDSNNLKPFINNKHTFQLSLLDSILSCEFPFCFFASIFQPCFLFYIRYKVLNLLHPDNAWTNYSIFQGYYPLCCCFDINHISYNNFPRTSLFLESLCCPSMAISSTRFLLMDKYDLTLDPCDNRIVRVNNFIQVADCICIIASKFDYKLLKIVKILDLFSSVIYLTTIGCMITQINKEVMYRQMMQPLYSNNYNQMVDIFINNFDPNIDEYHAPTECKIIRNSSISNLQNDTTYIVKTDEII